MNEMFAKNFEQEDQERQERRKEGESCNKKSTEDDDDMYYTKNSNTSSGDSGYGTHHQRTKETRLKAQDVFESVEKKSSRKNSINSSKLSLFFSTKSRNKKEPHFVKFQTWSNSNNKFNHSQEQQHHRKSSSTVHGSPVEEVHQPELMLLPIARRKSSSSLDDATCANHLKLFDEYGNLQAKYKLGNVIGKGHFGTVYRALDLLSGKTVAIKQIDLKSSKKQDIKDMIQEAKLLSSLVHPNIVKYEGFIQTQDHINIVLEYVENGSLLNTLKSFGNSLPEHLVACYCQRILKGLTYLHQQHVVHCDLKAANILTTKSGDVKLSDFGVSLNLKLKKNEDENAVSGTPFWMSPEVIELKGASIKSDIWSLGCTIIELCTGKPPYSDLMAMSAMFKIVEEDHPPIPNNISTELKDFLKLCFKKDPSQRPSTNELLRHTWILQQQPLDIISTTTSSSMLIKKSTAHKSNSSATVFSSKHVHSLIDCSFSKEAGTCKACDLPIKRNAFVCKDFCGYICHKQCNTLNRNPKPTISVSTQLRDKFSFSKLIITHTHEQSQKWWKRRPSPKEIR